MLQRPGGSRLDAYLARKRAFDRRRRKLHLTFDALHDLFARGLNAAQIARRAGVSRPRIDRIFDQYFRDPFGMSGLARRRLREKVIRTDAERRLARAIADDPVLTAVARSAAKEGRRVAPILCLRRGPPRKRFRHRAVLVDGKHVELVRHVRNAQVWPGGIAYATTSIARTSLESARHVIFYIDVASHRRRVIRCSCAALLRALFPARVKRRHIYIPLDHRPESPRYDFLANENNWRR
jgi:AraC-like DNA-binding protein